MKPPDEKSLGELLSNPDWSPARSERSPEETSQNGEEFLRAIAVMHGEDPDVVLELVRKNDPLARTILKALGITPARKARLGRREDVGRNFQEYKVIAALRAEGLSGDELWETAREKLGTDKTVESLKRTHTRTRRKHPIALAFSLHPPKRTK